ncbi:MULTISPECIES: RpoE-regulated lipoprotein [Photorhabdus]|uniref:RpoE-regulated lipoprotein n=1 Tax=Photorhabdus thracensis TaxID=230089 RepID=A0A0F7LJ43_9GAMM|nr:RpoE-regulated lipoprotein [Photorhabdus thracensis]AKH62093.1 RpoE-regulated lipoprotein [Photorhabdus thracensis]MCC8420295.1 RpoE-regulated lipoprotein [Photorhabdus thracensis]
MQEFSLTNILSGLRFAAIGCSLLLAGCAGSSGFSWSSLSPFSWFGGSLKISAQGVGEINSLTAMNKDAIDKGLDGKYHLRSGMETKNGQLVTVFQAMEGDQLKIELFGQAGGKVSRIDVLDKDIETVWGTKIGTPFSALYNRAFDACRNTVSELEKRAVICVSPQSKNVSYLFTGNWNGPEGLMPSDDVLKSWKVERIIWKR